jgi:DNA-3-methyladenine glycosylase I
VTAAVPGPDGKLRCPWALSAPDYLAYHDDEWGRPIRARGLAADRAMYERMTLEAFQSGLSWLTILRKREGFRAAFAGFEPEKVAEFGPADVERLLGDPGIVRNRSKIEATIHNARAVADLPVPFAELLWSFAPQPRPRRPRAFADLAATSPESKAMAKDLKRRGFRFVGPTTAHALMQATGMVDDHLDGCHVPP